MPAKNSTGASLPGREQRRADNRGRDRTEVRAIERFYQPAQKQQDDAEAQDQFREKQEEIALEG